jgi:hypothetical protein
LQPPSPIPGPGQRRPLERRAKPGLTRRHTRRVTQSSAFSGALYASRRLVRLTCAHAFGIGGKVVENQAKRPLNPFERFVRAIAGVSKPEADEVARKEKEKDERQKRSA